LVSCVLANSGPKRVCAALIAATVTQFPVLPCFQPDNISEPLNMSSVALPGGTTLLFAGGCGAILLFGFGRGCGA